MALGGAATGAMQIGRGLYNTPAAFRSSLSGKDWDDELKEWVEHNLVEEEKSGILSMTEEEYLLSLGSSIGQAAQDADPSSSQSPKKGREVADREFYDILGVTPDATPSGSRSLLFVTAHVLSIITLTVLSAYHRDQESLLPQG